MASPRSRTDRLAAWLADRVIRHRWLVLLLSLTATAAMAYGGQFITMSNNYRAFFSPKNPDLVAFESFQKTYTRSDNVLFVVQPEAGGVFSPEAAKAIESLTTEAWKLPYATRVDSITNFQHSWAQEDDLTVEDLIRGADQLSPEALADKQKVALAEPLLKNSLVDADASTTGVNVTLQFPEKSITEVPEAAAAARALAARFEAEYPIKIALTGMAMMNATFAESGMGDAMTLVPLMYLVLILATLLALRSISGTLSTLLVIGLSTLVAMGFSGYMGYGLTPISMTAPTIILTLAIADSIHILVTMLSLMRAGASKHDALRESIRTNFLAVTITSVTTIVGFLSLNASDAPPFWHLGNMTAVGIGAAWLFSLAFMPAVMSLLPVRVKVRPADQTDRSGRLFGRLADFVIARHKPILLGTGALAVGLAAVVPTLDLNDEWVKYFDERIPFRQDSDFTMNHLTGIYPIEYSVKAPEAGGISDPEYLQNLEAFTGWLRTQPEVTHVFSYADIIKRLNKNMHGDEATWYKVPEDRALAAQYLLLYELSLPYGLDLNDRVNIDKSATRVTATLKEISTVGVRDFKQRTEAWLAEHVPDGMAAEATGPTMMFSFVSKRNIDSMLSGNAVAVVLIAFIMILSLRSFSLGALSLIPNAIPILMTFGTWALLVGQVGMAAATVSATSLGLVVDNTIHFLTKYLRARREKGYDAPEAIRYAFTTVGLAIAVNAVILAGGFAVLAGSTFKINSDMGLLTALAIVIALAVDFLLLPALLLITSKPSTATAQEERSPNHAVTA